MNDQKTRRIFLGSALTIGVSGLTLLGEIGLQDGTAFDILRARIKDQTLKSPTLDNGERLAQSEDWGNTDWVREPPDWSKDIPS